MKGKFYKYNNKIYLIKDICIIDDGYKKGIICQELINGILYPQIYVIEFEKFIKNSKHIEKIEWR